MDKTIRAKDSLSNIWNEINILPNINPKVMQKHFSLLEKFVEKNLKIGAIVRCSSNVLIDNKTKELNKTVLNLLNIFKENGRTIYVGPFINLENPYPEIDHFKLYSGSGHEFYDKIFLPFMKESKLIELNLSLPQALRSGPGEQMNFNEMYVSAITTDELLLPS